MNRTLVLDRDGQPTPIAGVWRIDPSHSSVAFEARHMLTRMRGRFRQFDGEVHIADSAEASFVRVRIEAATVDTTNGLADETLRGANFLNAAEHPDLTFSSRTVARVPDGTYNVRGTLTIAGISQPIELAVAFVGAINSPHGQAKATFRASVCFDRRDFGMTWNVPVLDDVWLVGHEVTVELEIEADLVDGDA